MEKLGRIALRHSRVAALIVALATALGLVGVSQVRFDDDVTRAFRSDSETYADLLRFTRETGRTANDTIVMASSDDPLDAGDIVRLRDLHIELTLVEGLELVFSAFSLREPGPIDEERPPIVPEELADDELPAVMRRAREHPLGLGRAFSEDGRAMIFLLDAEDRDRDRGETRALLDRIEQTVDAFREPGLTLSVVGMPKTRFEISDAIFRDQIVFNSLGSVLAFLVSLLFFRDFRLATLAFAPGMFALIWCIGFAGLVGMPISVVTNVVPVLVMVLCLTDSMHLVHSYRSGRSMGESVDSAVDRTVVRIGPACALTSLTTAAAFLSLTLTGFGALTDLGLFGAVSAAIAFIAVITVFPLLAPLIARHEMSAPARRRAEGGPLLRATDAMVGRHYRLIPLIGVVLLGMGLVGHATTQPRFSTYDNIPDGSVLKQASRVAEERFGGAFNLWLAIDGEPRDLMTSEQGWRRIARVSDAVETITGPNSVLSPISLRRALGGSASEPFTPAELDRLEERLQGGFGVTGGERLYLGLLTGDPGDTPESKARFDAVEAAALEAGASAVVGTPVLARYDGEEMITALNLSLLVAAVLTVALVVFAFRSLALFPAIALANLTPILLTGAALHLVSAGQFLLTAGMAMTIAFGVAVDDTIHYLNRVLLERREGTPVRVAVGRAIVGVGTVLVATTAILCAGVLVTQFSSFITVRLFGQLTVIILVLALLADLVILPAMLLAWRRWAKSP